MAVNEKKKERVKINNQISLLFSTRASLPVNETISL